VSRTGEIAEGKRTLIERNGKEFELPDQHTARLIVAVDESGKQWVSLNTPGEGSLFAVDTVEERGDAVVIHLGAELGRHGLGSFGDRASEPRGYPFPND